MTTNPTPEERNTIAAMDTPDTYFAVEVHLDEDPPRVAALGELDAASSKELETALVDARAEGSVALDLTDVSFIDSSGLRVVTGAARDAEAGSVGFVICGASEAVRRIFEITGLGELLPHA
jgi:anti-anti-sigma factor